MSDSSVQNLAPKKEWLLKPSAFRRLLSWLDEDASSEGQRYLEIRRRLVAYFDRKNCLAPDELADETLNRVARRLEEEDAIETETPAKYCYTLARFVFMEYLRETRKSIDALEEMQRGQDRNDALIVEFDAEKERMLNCLERCTRKLEPANRELITRYYIGRERVKIENRRALAASLGITTNALSIRACRIRDKLEECVRRCVGA